jgi:gentisate 1,2-dioxygenase
MAIATASPIPDPRHNLAAMRQAYYDKISRSHMTPLWEVLKGLVAPLPNPQAVPHVWHFDDARKLVIEAGEVITAEEAERRVLVLENPNLRGQSRATDTLFAGIQMILPGETAPAHRHVASAIRFVLDGAGAYTAVDGEKAVMAPGDFVITANWAPHDHGNASDEPMLWLDVLDMHTVNFFKASFAEHFDAAAQSTPKTDGDSLARYGSGVLPDGAPVHARRTPVINYTYARMRPILARMKASGDIDRRHGARIHYVNPLTGGPVVPTMGANLALFPKGFAGEPYRSTDGRVFVCAEGRGASHIGGESLEWRRNDVFVVPSWMPVAHTAMDESVLFSISDRPAQEALGIWREGL